MRLIYVGSTRLPSAQWCLLAKGERTAGPVEITAAFPELSVVGARPVLQARFAPAEMLVGSVTVTCSGKMVARLPIQPLQTTHRVDDAH